MARTKEQMAAYQRERRARKKGVVTIEQAREMEDLPPLPSKDVDPELAWLQDVDAVIEDPAVTSLIATELTPVATPLLDAVVPVPGSVSGTGKRRRTVREATITIVEDDEGVTISIPHPPNVSPKVFGSLPALGDRPPFSPAPRR